MRREVYGYLTVTLHHNVMSLDATRFASSKNDVNELSKMMRLSRALREELNSFWRLRGTLAIYTHRGSSSYPLGVKGSLLEMVSNAPNLRLIFSMRSLEKMALEKVSWPRQLLFNIYGSTLSHDLKPLLQLLKNQRRCQITLSFYTMASQLWSQDSWRLPTFVSICQRLSHYQEVTIHLRYCGISGLLDKVKPRFVQLLLHTYCTEGDSEDIDAFAEQMFEQASGRARNIRETLGGELESSLGPVIAEAHQTLGLDLEIVLSFRPAQHSAGNTASQGLDITQCCSNET